MSITNLSSQEKDAKLDGYSNKDWSQLEDSEQVEYAILLYDKASTIDDKSKDIITREINNYRVSPNKEENTAFDKVAYYYLNSELNLKGYEYMYLSWLSKKYKYPIITNNLSIENILHSHSLEYFKEKYGMNKQRKALIHNLMFFIDTFKQAVDINSIRFIIGGSFATKKEYPSDIDFAILINSNVLSNGFELDRDFYILTHDVPKGLDFYFLPEDFKGETYYEYNIIHRLSNDAKYKDKDKTVTSFRNNNFNQIELIDLIM